jgi:hypothetical protein
MCRGLEQAWDRVIFGQPSNFCGGKILPLFAAELTARVEEKEKLNKAQGVSYFRDDCAGSFEVRTLVRRRYHGAQTRLAFGNCGESNRGNVDA